MQKVSRIRTAADKSAAFQSQGSFGASRVLKTSHPNAACQIRLDRSSCNGKREGRRERGRVNLCESRRANPGEVDADRKGASERAKRRARGKGAREEVKERNEAREGEGKEGSPSVFDLRYRSTKRNGRQMTRKNGMQMTKWPAHER
eukprot:6172177-Pleurochrysis_carterae.AAC.2